MLYAFVGTSKLFDDHEKGKGKSLYTLANAQVTYSKSKYFSKNRKLHLYNHNNMENQYFVKFFKSRLYSRSSEYFKYLY